MTIRHRLGLLLLATAGLACSDAPSDDGLVARVGPYVLTVEDVAEMVVDQEELPAQAGIIRQVADIWIEYALLADAAARDSTFSKIDFAPLVREQIQQLMILQLRDSLVKVDTIVSDAELEEIYLADDPPVQMRARHILLAYPTDPSPANRESVRSQAEALRARIVNGESFDALARQHSQDPGTASLGGDLGFFGRGDMMEPIENALLALQPGQVSDPVETQFGLHLIRLDERRIQGFEEIAADLRQRVLAERYLLEDSAFVEDAGSQANPVLVEGAHELARGMARDPGGRLSRRAMNRTVVAYDGGEVTVGELQFILQTQGPDFQAQVVQGEDDQIERFLTSLVQRELLVGTARQLGLEPTEARVDSLVEAARGQLIQAAHSLSLIPLDRAPGEELTPAVRRASVDAVGRVVTGVAEIVRLGAVGYQLRRGKNPTVYSEGIGRAILAIGQLRVNRSPSLFESATDSVGR